MSDIQLYHYWRSSCSWRVRWALELKGVPHGKTAVNLLKDEQKTPTYKKVNPNATVPTLVVDGRNLTDSFAIIEWLDEVYGSKERLLPTDPWKKAEMRSFVMQIAAGIQPLGNLKVINYYSAEAEKKKEWIQHFLGLGFEGVEEMLRGTAGQFSFGDSVSMADLFLIPQVYNALRFEMDMGRFPLAKKIYENCLKTPACDRAAPHNQEGAVV